MLKRLLALTILVAFGANTLAPGLLHGCQDSWGHDEAMAPMAGMHHAEPARREHHHQGSQSQGHSHGCQCVGHSCCYTMAAISSAVVFPTPLLLPLRAGATPRYSSARITRPSHLLPPAQAPPPVRLRAGRGASDGPPVQPIDLNSPVRRMVLAISASREQEQQGEAELEKAGCKCS
jgi:hypothetical protein